MKQSLMKYLSWLPYLVLFLIMLLYLSLFYFDGNKIWGRLLKNEGIILAMIHFSAHMIFTSGATFVFFTARLYRQNFSEGSFHRFMLGGVLLLIFFAIHLMAAYITVGFLVIFLLVQLVEFLAIFGILRVTKLI